MRRGIVKAIRYYTYGSPEVIKLQDVDMPEVADDGVLVRVKAASVNPLDWHYMRGMPYFMRASAGLSRPKDNTLGVDLAGYVEATGKNVTRFQPGDEVFGVRGGALAEYVSVRENGVIQRKPANLTFEQAASVPVAAFTALQALRDKAGVQPGHKVLINGAAGGVGTFAVQIAKALGAQVTGVCSTGNVEMVRSIGADRVIDYTREDFTRTGQRHDVMIDNAGSRTLSECRRVLTPKAVLVVVGGPNKGQWLGPLLGLAKMVVFSRFVSQRVVAFLTKNNKEDLAFLSELLEAGKVTPVIDRTYPLTEVPAAIGYLEEGHAKGKVVITV
jgi:NADPH:quinone reductase-like Zn-dependent oxidoreductase